jgi:hypothetical protein
VLIIAAPAASSPAAIHLRFPIVDSFRGGNAHAEPHL